MNQLKNLLQLANDNRGKSRPVNVETEGDTAVVYLYGLISSLWGDIDALDFARQFAAIKASTIHLRINSPGGDVFDARSMMTAIRQHPAKVIAHIDGVAASAATGVAMAADEVEMTRGADFMIHNCWTLSLGDWRDMQATADLLKRTDGELARDYALRTKQDQEQVAAWMNAETWMGAEEALERGFVDRVVESVRAVTPEQAWNLSAYANAPKPRVDDPGVAAAAHRNHMERRLALLEKTA